MKCLLCNFISQNEANMKVHYHITELIRVIFFKKLIAGGQNSFYGRNCFHCGEFLTTKFSQFFKTLRLGI